ncbi:MAG: CYTH domain-containing protein [Lachnospiraceae bacterium]|nr:CYTH domain-containing protein [Lachnospiraceae bacterium]
MEIERKFLIDELPSDLSNYPFHRIEQAYLCTSPVIRIRRQDDDYILTYKGKGMMVREEYNLPLTAEAYAHLLPKTDGNLLTKKRYVIPLTDALTIELDLFEGKFSGLWMAEVEFPDEAAANAFTPPDWFGREVTYDPAYHNSNMSQQK